MEIYVDKMRVALKKEWNDVEKAEEQLVNLFKRWMISNIVEPRYNGRSIYDKFGLPYTSSSDYAGIWNCQGEALYKWNLEWRFESLAISENNDAVVVFEHEDGTMETLDRMYILIGKVDD